VGMQTPATLSWPLICYLQAAHVHDSLGHPAGPWPRREVSRRGPSRILGRTSRRLGDFSPEIQTIGQSVLDRFRSSGVKKKNQQIQCESYFLSLPAGWGRGLSWSLFADHPRPQASPLLPAHLLPAACSLLLHAHFKLGQTPGVSAGHQPWLQPQGANTCRGFNQGTAKTGPLCSGHAPWGPPVQRMPLLPVLQAQVPSHHTKGEVCLSGSQSCISKD
jgi:hypothetical protein